ncbi:hypothetical protein RRG08_034357 [Elysia crispata]|uniref:Uncharacterized protein n=1 Tax=Elysia crispata TaxID=231223 RepID=A0AAE0YDX9_9GAST|nr:hypothetical protein RRG08_034357 [Elysia crispata]
MPTLITSTERNNRMCWSSLRTEDSLPIQTLRDFSKIVWTVFTVPIIHKHNGKTDGCRSAPQMPWPGAGWACNDGLAVSIAMIILLYLRPPETLCPTSLDAVSRRPIGAHAEIAHAMPTKG